MEQIKYAIGKKLEDASSDTKELSDVVSDQAGEKYYKILHVSSNLDDIMEHIDGLRAKIGSLLLLKISERKGQTGLEYKVLEVEES